MRLFLTIQEQIDPSRKICRMPLISFELGPALPAKKNSIEEARQSLVREPAHKVGGQDNYINGSGEVLPSFVGHPPS